ncbi:MAG: hypothetical protein V4685_16995 [Bacteroidota bacterium]
MKHPTTNRRIFWQATIFLFFVVAYCSCKKTDVNKVNDRNLYAEKFFQTPAASSPQLQAVIDMLKKENEKTGFINTLTDNAGLPVWDKLIKEKPKSKTGVAERGIIADKDGNMLIPLSNDNKTLSALLFVMNKDGKYQFYCYDNNYAHQIAFSDKHSLKQREYVMALFMNMSNYVFGIHEFKSIPKDFFDKLGSIPEENGITKKLFLVPDKGTPPDIFTTDRVVGTVTTCGYKWSGRCNCPENPNDYDQGGCQDWWKGCPYNYCSEWACITVIYEEEDPIEPVDGSNGGDKPPSNSSNGWSNGQNLTGGPLPNTFYTGGLPNAPCSNNCAWYTEAPEHEFDQEPPVIPPLCDMTMEEALQAINAIIAVEAQDEVKINYGSEWVDANGIIRKPVAPSFGLVSFSGWGSTPIHYSAYFGGVIYKNNMNDRWKWESCTYNYTGLDGGTIPPCIEISHNVNVSPIVISDDKLDASAYMSFQFYARATCITGLTDRHLLHSGGDRTYQIPMGN